MSEVALEARCCEICGGPIRPNNTTGICTSKDRPECKRANERANERRKQQEAGIPEHRRCEVCGRPIRDDNRYGVCSSPKRPACVQVYNQRAWAARNQDKPEPRSCEVCGDPIRCDNKTGICRNPERIGCQRERRRREALRDGRTPPFEFFPGDTFGHWTVLEHYYARGGGGVLVRCDCRRRTIRRVRPGRLNEGTSTSCGCERYATRARKKAPYLTAGSVFGCFTVLDDVATWKDQALVHCGECGDDDALVQAIRVKLGLAKSCGCLTRTHGFSKHPLYQLWASIVQRCTNPNHVAFHRYGGRGIRICDRWWHDPWLFAEDIYREIGPRPDERDEKGRVLYEIDRIDNMRGYEPGNVRWADKKTQRANQRTVADQECLIAVVTAERDAVTVERDALAAEVAMLKAQLREPDE